MSSQIQTTERKSEKLNNPYLNNSDEYNSSETEASSVTTTESKESSFNKIPENYDYSKELYIVDSHLSG